ncbi:MAG: anti-sigma factor family protein [Planctomycetota bacterium]|jgi:hypothetical protein
MKCDECREQFAAYFEGLVEPEVIQEIRAHLEGCPTCRAEAESIERLRERLARNGDAPLDNSLADAVMGAIREKRTETEPKRRIAMILKHRRGMSAVAASLVVAATVALIVLLGNGTSAAYAIEKAVEAAKKITSVHFVEWVPLERLQSEVPVDGEVTERAWADYDGTDGDLALRQEVRAEFDGQGQLVRLRLEWPVTEDGRKEILLTPGQADIWFVHKNGYLITRSERAVSMYSQAFLDPSKRMERLDKAIKAGTARIESTDSSSEDGTRTYVVVYPQLPSRVERFVIDQKSHLLKEVSSYRKSAGVNALVSVTEFVDYDKPIDAAMWVLNAPPDVMRVDHLSNLVGIAKEGMTNAEVAREGARQFFEAMIAGDYETAGVLVGGVPAEYMKKEFGALRYVRVVSIGEPTPPDDLRRGGLVVPCTVEIEVEGSASEKVFNIGIRPVLNQPDRWHIYSGI